MKTKQEIRELLKNIKKEILEEYNSWALMKQTPKVKQKIKEIVSRNQLINYILDEIEE